MICKGNRHSFNITMLHIGLPEPLIFTRSAGIFMQASLQQLC